MQTLTDLLDDAAAAYGDRPALAMQSGLRFEEWSYLELREAVHAVAHHLSETRGIGRGERVLVWGPNSPQLVAAYLGCMAAGLIVVPLDPQSDAAFARSVAQHTDPALLLAAEGGPAVEHVQTVALESLPFAGEAPAPAAPPRAEEVAEIVFTSGTTGEPKGVVLTHGNIVANVRALDGIVPRGEELRLLSLLPLSHMLEQSIGLLLPLSYGATVTYLHSRQPSTIFRTLERRRITAMAVVPLVLDVMLKGIEQELRREGKLGRWRTLHAIAPRLPMRARRLLFRPLHRRLGGELAFFLCGGAYLEPELQAAWERTGIPVVQGYGATECAPVVATNTLDDRAAGSIGRPIRGVRTRISEEGELLVAGPNVTPGYWRNPEATAAAFTEDGFYRTGDLAEERKDGRLVLRGRLRDMIVLPSGFNVYPEDVERELLREEDVADCVVLALPDDGGRPRVHAVILPLRGEDGPPPDAQRASEAVRRANKRLMAHQRISGHTLWQGDDFPRTRTLKVRRQELLAVLLGESSVERPADDAEGAHGDGPDASGPGSDGADFERLRRVLAEVCDLPAEQITPGARLEDDLGLDSLLRVELAIALEEECGAAMDEEQLARVATVGALHALLAGEAPRASTRSFPRWALSAPATTARAALQRAVVFPLHALFCRPFRVEGRDRVAAAGAPVLLIANHSSHLDAPSVLRALPAELRRRTAVAAADDYFYRGRWRGGAATAVLNTFPFARSGSVRPSLEYCAELVERGWSVLIYPEGTRSPDGRLQEFERGIGVLAMRLGVPVVPVAIWGTHEVLPKGQRLPRRGAVRVRFGAPITVPRDALPAAVSEPAPYGAAAPARG